MNEFKCLDGTCIPWEKLCDHVQDCPKSEQGPGGEDEDFWPEGSGEDSEGGCSPPERPVPSNYVAIYLMDKRILISVQTIITFGLMQLPAICLALYGIFCACSQPGKRVIDRILNSLLAVAVVALPYCFTELLTLVQFEFTDKGVDFIVKRIKSLWSPIYNKIVDLFPDKAKTSFDLLWFLPNKDPNGRER